MTAMEPGIYEMSADEYHARPELSSSGARKLLPPHTPAQFAYERRHPQAPTDEMVWRILQRPRLVSGDRP
jgi:hypothetical protein